MNNEHGLARDAERAAQADVLLKNELLQSAFMGLEDTYIAAWRTTSASDTNARERLWQALQIVGKVRDHLTKIAANGRLAQKEIDQLAEKRKRFGIV